MAAKDRWHELADAIGASNLPASDKSVFRLLLDRADCGTAVLPAKFAPTEIAVGKRTSHSRRQVQYSVAHLRRHGWLKASLDTRQDSPDRRRLRYELGVGTTCDCTGRVHAPRQKGATESTDRRNSCADMGATDRRNATGQTPSRTERQREGGVEGKFELKPESSPEPASVRVLGDGSGPDDRDSFHGWLALISRRAEPSRGTPPGRQP
jgi:hypothetical protein